MTITKRPHFLPSTRAALSPPGLPLPAARRSTAPRDARRATRSADGNIPSTYPTRAPSRICATSDIARPSFDAGSLMCGASAARDVAGLGLALTDPRHHRPQAVTDLFDRVLGRLLAQRVEHRPAGLVLEDPLLRELAGLDLVEDLLHLRARFVGDDARPTRHVAVLGGVADRVAHVGDAALVDEVDDELHLVQRLEVRRLGLVSRVHQCLVARLDELDETAAEHHLLTEEVGLGLLLERGVEHAGTRRADRARVRERGLLRLAGLVGRHCDERGHTATFLVGATHEVTGSLGCDHPDVDALGRVDLAEVDVEPVR